MSKQIKSFLKINSFFYLNIIIFFQICLIKKILTGPLCSTRCDSCDHEGDEIIHNCLVCKTSENYYFIHGIPLQCYTKEEANKIGSYYRNIATNEFEECHEVCQSCYDGNTPTELDNRCITCKDGYYKKDSLSSTNCYLPYNIPNNYYKEISEDNSIIFLPCHERCNTCSQSGTDEENNCDSCKVGTSLITQYYKLNSEETGNCYLINEIPTSYEIPIKNELNKLATQKLNERNNITSNEDENYVYIYDLIV